VGHAQPFAFEAHVPGIQRVSDTRADAWIKQVEIVYEEHSPAGSRENAYGYIPLASRDRSFKIQSAKQTVICNI
jgi:hypothetical protein